MPGWLVCMACSWAMRKEAPRDCKARQHQHQQQVPQYQSGLCHYGKRFAVRSRRNGPFRRSGSCFCDLGTD
eukprot:422647-Pelagomonas_calceolata.AAC.1